MSEKPTNLENMVAEQDKTWANNLGDTIDSEMSKMEQEQAEIRSAFDSAEGDTKEAFYEHLKGHYENKSQEGRESWILGLRQALETGPDLPEPEIEAIKQILAEIDTGEMR